MRLASLLICVLATAGAFVKAQFHVSDPDALIYGEQVLLLWTGGTSPYTVDLIRTGSTDGSVLKTLAGSINATSLSWTVDVAVGTSVTVAVKDASRVPVYSTGVVVQAAGSSFSTSSSAETPSATVGLPASSASITATSPLSPTSASLPSSSSPSAPAAALSASAASASSSVAADAVSAAASNGLSSGSIGGIVGGVVAAVVLGAAAAFLLILCRQRARRASRPPTWLTDDDEPSADQRSSDIALQAVINPFMTPPASAGTAPSMQTYFARSHAHSATDISSPTTTMNGSQAATSPGAGPFSPELAAHAAPPRAAAADAPVDPRRTKLSGMSAAPPPGVEPNILVEVDGGAAPASLGRAPTVRLPPAYDPTIYQR